MTVQTSPTIVDTPARLAAALAEMADLRTVGVDVERSDWDRYWRAAALIQVGGPRPGDDGAETDPSIVDRPAGMVGRVALIDPLAVDDLSALGEFFADRTVVLHAMDNDLVPLEATGAAPAAVEDTAIAAALLGLPTGLGDLLHQQLGIDLPGDKHAMQRADWSRRPLSEAMMQYAAEDVVHLEALWQCLEQQLRVTGRLDWYLEERDWVRSQPTAEERRHWTRVRGLGRLDAQARARARSLWEAREHLARSTDTAPGRILADRVLVQLAVEPVQRARELARRGVRRAAVKEFGTELVAALRGVGRSDPAPRRRPLDEQERQLVDELRALRSARAAQVGIDAGVLAPNRVLRSAVGARPTTPAELRTALELRDWQWRLVGADFCEACGLDGAGRPAPPAVPPTPPTD